jgi:predicted amidohydrolase
MRLACIQTNPQEDLERNVSEIFETCRQVASQGANLIVLPEMFAYMGPDAGRLTIASPIGTGIFLRLSELARSLGVALVGGSHPEPSEDSARVFNTSVVFDGRGTRLSTYRKIHLFNLWGPKGEKLFCESDTFCPGDSVAPFDLPVGSESWHSLAAICYDLRFPELFRTPESKTRPYDLIVLPAAFTHATGKAHWETLLRARAIENQCYVVACNQTGSFQNGTKRNYGHSMVISPWGEVVAALEEEVGVLWATLNREEIHAARSRLPAYRNRVLA